MSDSYAIRRHHRQEVTPLGTNPRKKYLVLFLAILLGLTAGLVYYAYTSGFLAENNPTIPRQMMSRINLERQAGNLPPVELSGSLTADAVKTSNVIRVSPMGYQSGAAADPAEGTNVIVVPKVSWAVAGLDSQHRIFTALENDNSRFRENILNPAYDSVGIGVSSDSYNYYIVTIWK
jgi:uncharacterized protein YkwD